MHGGPTAVRRDERPEGLMRIRFKRTGTDHETDINLDLDGLPRTQAEDLLRLIEAADFFNLPENLGTAALLDEPQYVLAVEDHNGRRHVVNVNDGSVPPALRPLLEKLNSLADTRAAKKT
jgi:emfourin